MHSLSQSRQKNCAGSSGCTEQYCTGARSGCCAGSESARWRAGVLPPEPWPMQLPVALLTEAASGVSLCSLMRPVLCMAAAQRRQKCSPQCQQLSSAGMAWHCPHTSSWTGCASAVAAPAATRATPLATVAFGSAATKLPPPRQKGACCPMGTGGTGGTGGVWVPRPAGAAANQTAPCASSGAGGSRGPCTHTAALGGVWVPDVDHPGTVAAATDAAGGSCSQICRAAAGSTSVNVPQQGQTAAGPLLCGQFSCL
mmetsp:Transcript_111004/g.358332  ORF Transcript_111004/g.358332 Transcript_111004/m.358332 type:complete len:255 (-) Transcript_111004:161-925(-)